MILINQVNDKIQITQIKYDKFAVVVNDIIIRQSQDLETIEQPTSQEIKDYMKSYRQLKRHLAINKKNQKRIEKSHKTNRQEFIATEIINQTRQSKEYKLIRRQNKNFDINFMDQPIWTNISIENIENWLERTGLRDATQEASKFWTEQNN